MTQQDIKKAHRFSSNNMPELWQDKKCGCFYCLKIFDPCEITEIIEDSYGTGLCPYCGIDSLIGEYTGYPITKEFLDAMYDYWFSDGKMLKEKVKVLNRTLKEQ